MDRRLTVKQYTISNDLFEKGYRAGGGPCTCTGVCCRGGVWTDVQEYERIIAKKDIITRHMDETQSTDATRWFEPKVEEDSDFPSGKAVGTEVIHEKCAFLNKHGQCSIQLAASAAGEHKWAWKPLYCILFPLEVSGNIVGFDPMLQGDQPCCTVSDDFEIPLFVACKEELVHLLGEDGFAMMERHYASTYQRADATMKSL